VIFVAVDHGSHEFPLASAKRYFSWDAVIIDATSGRERNRNREALSNVLLAKPSI
jgi:hypothetical protein